MLAVLPRVPTSTNFEQQLSSTLKSQRAMTSESEPVIKSTDMAEELQFDAIRVARQAMDKFNVEKDVAACIKKEFDDKHNPTWHCVVGKNFGSYVTHETSHFIYFYLGPVAVLLFKSG